MSDQMVLGIFGVIVTLIAIMTPIIKLNSNITRLTVAVEKLEALVKDKTDKLDERVTKHGREIDELKNKQTEHEERIKHLEK